VKTDEQNEISVVTTTIVYECDSCHARAPGLIEFIADGHWRQCLPDGWQTLSGKGDICKTEITTIGDQLEAMDLKWLLP